MLPVVHLTGVECAAVTLYGAGLLMVRGGLACGAATWNHGDGVSLECL